MPYVKYFYNLWSLSYTDRYPKLPISIASLFDQYNTSRSFEALALSLLVIFHWTAKGSAASLCYRVLF